MNDESKVKQFYVSPFEDAGEWFVHRNEEGDYIELKETKRKALRLAREKAEEFEDLFDRVEILLKEPGGEFEVYETY